MWKDKYGRKWLDMRDIERIDRICGLLAEVWKKYPDNRLGQLLECNNIFPVVFRDHTSFMWPFAQEDDVTEAKLRKL
jgi:hypothetical protein